MMDRWIISSLQSLIKTVNEKMENYYLYEVIPPLMNFVEELTNWYVRSNRKRFWKEKDENDIDKINAFKTLHEVLTEFTKSMAPVLPFICEKIYQGLNNDENGSIHYENYPVSNQKLIDLDLEDDIELAKKVIKSVRNLRVKLKLPNKQPLNSVKIVTNDKNIEKRLLNISDLIKNEINVKNVYFDVEIPYNSMLTIEVYNLLGQKVDMLYNGFIGPGVHNMNWIPESLPSGVYFLNMKTENFINTKKMILLK